VNDCCDYLKIAINCLLSNYGDTDQPRLSWSSHYEVELMRRNLLLDVVCSTSILVIASNAAYAFEDPLVRLRAIDSFAGIGLGRGYDIVTGSPRGSCVNFDPVSEQIKTGQDQASFESTEIASLSELADQLGLSASSTFKGGFGAASASAAFARSSAFSRYSLHSLVRARLLTGGERLASVTMKPAFLEMALSEDPKKVEAFRMACGDGYISESIYGGEFNSLVTVITSSQSQQESISGTLEISAPIASGSASFEQKIEEISKNTQVKIRTYQRGGNGEAFSITVSDIKNRAQNLPSLANKNPVILQVVVSSYILLEPELNQKIPDFISAENSVIGLARQFREAADRQATLDYIIDNGDQFYLQPFDLPKLAAERKEVSSFMLNVDKAASDCIVDRTTCDNFKFQVPSPVVHPARR